MYTRGFIALAAAAIVALANGPRLIAQSISLEVEHGLVTLDARNASVREILERWARLRAFEIVNLEGVSNVPFPAFQLAGVPERVALATLLRDAYGYVVMARHDGPGTVGRIMIVSPSTRGLSIDAGVTQTAAPLDLADAGSTSGAPPLPAPATAVSSSFIDGAGGLGGPGAETERGEGVPFVAPVPSTPRITEMPLGTAVQIVPSGSPVPPNPFGITAGSSRPGLAAPVAAPAVPAADGSVTYRSGGDMIPESPQH